MKKSSRYIFLQKLLDEKERIEKIIHGVDNTNFGAIDKYYEELSMYDNHPADIGTEVFMMEHDRGLRNRLKDALYDIEKSIEEIESETYGFCNECGGEIDEERLELIPYTKLCIDCSKDKLELDIEGDNRSVEREKVNPFIGIDNEGNEFDREDAYQEVARFNRIENDPSFATGDQMGVLDEEGSGAVEEVERISQDDYNETNK